MSNAILKTIEICKTFGNRNVVDKVSFAVKTGEIRGIIGESGSGKTTLARCCLRLTEPSAGESYYDGLNLGRLTANELRLKRREFQMVFQDPFGSLNPTMTVREILAEPLHIQKIGTAGEREALVQESSESVAIEGDLMERRAGQLSGGQQQRVGIARALMLKPRLLIADEPVSALDVSVQAQILNLLSDLRNKYDFTLILISHSLYAIHYLCSHISVMFNGRIVEEATAEVFFSKPKHPYSRLLLEAAQGKNIDSGFSSTSTRVAAKESRGCAFYSRCVQKLSICEREDPSKTELGSGEAVACFLHGK